jgi:hypothetical protein
MTGAIAFALGAPALFQSAREQTQSLTAPPSSVQRSVFVAAPPAPTRPQPAERLVIAPSVRPSAARPAAVHSIPSPGTVQRPRPNPKPTATGHRVPERKPKTRHVASVTPETAVPTSRPEAGAIQDPCCDKTKPKAKGKAKGHTKVKAAPAPTKTASTVEAATPTVTGPDDESDKPKDRGHGNGNGHGHGHDK